VWVSAKGGPASGGQFPPSAPMKTPSLRWAFLSVPALGRQWQLRCLWSADILVGDVITDLKLIGSDGGGKVSARPEGSCWQLVGTLFLEPVGRFAFDHLHGVGNRVFGRNHYVQVDVLVSDMPRE